MTRWLAVSGISLIFALAVACGGDDDSDSESTVTRTPGSSEPTADTTLQQALASVLLQAADLPEGLEGTAPSFSTNADISGPDQAVFARLEQVGRLLGADVQFIPTDRLDPDSPIRGGVQTSASVYLDVDGASETFQESVASARTNDWAANYPELEGVQTRELARTIGDESLWLRVSGLEECQFIETPTPAPDGTVPSPGECPDQKMVIVDHLIFRAGRTRAYIMVSTLFDPDVAEDVYADEVQGWAELVAGRAASTFPVS